MTTSRETKESFANRVLARCGHKLEEMAVGTVDDLLYGQIFCKRGDVYVVAVGCPSFQDEDGVEVWEGLSQFVAITMPPDDVSDEEMG